MKIQILQRTSLFGATFLVSYYIPQGGAELLLINFMIKGFPFSLILASPNEKSDDC